MAIRNYLLLVSVFLVIIQTGFALKCYNCTESNLKHCGDPFDKSSVPTMDCGTMQVCVKHKTPAIEMKSPAQEIPITIHRGCKPKDYCSTVNDFTDHCSTCSVELCNSSSYTVPTLSIISLMAVIRIIFIH